MTGATDMPDSHDGTPDQADCPLSCVGSYPDESAAHDHALVILAMGHACWIHRDPGSGDFHLQCESTAAGNITAELAAYDREQGDDPQLPDHAFGGFQHPAGWNAWAIWAASLIAVFALQQELPWLVDSCASSNIGLIDHHQWWRPFTALFLHADTPHLVGNLVSGLMFSTLVSRSVGPFRAWLMILVSGTLGNALTAWMTHPDPFVSLGASTAVFGALGILSGLGCLLMIKHRLRLPWLRILAPLIGGIVVLGMMGSGDPGGNTDVLGHVFGFSAGLVLGLTCGWLQPVGQA